MNKLQSTLIKSYSGSRYRFKVTAKLFSRGGEFSLRATHKKSKRYSSINNVNNILNVLENPKDDKAYRDPVLYDSIWVSSKKRVLQWFKKSNMLLTGGSDYSVIESWLDSDRECGEWENILK